jgi:hypothetical protein
LNSVSLLLSSNSSEVKNPQLTTVNDYSESTPPPLHSTSIIFTSIATDQEQQNAQ